ncbi:hypothetical protein GCM10010170_020890 [Dactylosporangium salmoneum]|uniref:Uncharacterized protein n=1 Tax=Dactylosporangium salmoneum TaxID=53361 RepID=A0ABP5SUE6_9ACTN
MTPVVSWPAQARPGGRYLVTVDLRLDEPGWPYPEEEYPVALMLSGRRGIEVSVLGDASVVLHRFGGTYGTARFLAAVDATSEPDTRSGLGLTLISAGGVPFHAVELPILIAAEAPDRPAVAPASPTAPDIRSDRLPDLPGNGVDAWSLLALTVQDRPALAMGTDAGTVRIWRPFDGVITEYTVAEGERVHVASIPAESGPPLLLAAAGPTLACLDPATGTTVARLVRPQFGMVTALATIQRPESRPLVALAAGSGVIHLLDSRPDFPTVGTLTGHEGPVFAMAMVPDSPAPTLVTAGTDALVRLWDIRQFAPIDSLVGHRAQINGITPVAGAGARPSVATASDDGTIRVWDLSTRSAAVVAEKRGEWINTVIELREGGRRPVLLWGGRSGMLTWSDRASRTLSSQGGFARRLAPVTALATFEWDRREIVAIAREGGAVALRLAADFRAAPRSPRPESSLAETDAIIAVPNILGSELVEVETGRVLWGAADPAWYVRALTTGSVLRSLAMTEDELAGRPGRVRPTRLLRAPAMLPVLSAIEPYTHLLRTLRRVVRHPDAVLEFPYDWRLSVAANARELAHAAELHLDRWRTHPQGSTSARLVLIGHGMGGLIARAFTATLGDDSEVALTIGIGVPYSGTVAALRLLTGGGAGVPVTRDHLRAFSGLPGIYDLLPTYRCVVDGSGVRDLTPHDVASSGGDRQLAVAALGAGRERRLLGGGPVMNIIGVGQPTPQSVRIESEQLTVYKFLPTDDGTQFDHGGDGVVPRFSAALPGDEGSRMYVESTSAAMCKSEDVLASIRARLTERPIGPLL